MPPFNLLPQTELCRRLVFEQRHHCCFFLQRKYTKRTWCQSGRRTSHAGRAAHRTPSLNPWTLTGTRTAWMSHLGRGVVVDNRRGGFKALPHQGLLRCSTLIGRSQSSWLLWPMGIGQHSTRNAASVKRFFHAKASCVVVLAGLAKTHCFCTVEIGQCRKTNGSVFPAFCIGLSPCTKLANARRNKHIAANLGVKRPLKLEMTGEHCHFVFREG